MKWRTKITALSEQFQNIIENCRNRNKINTLSHKHTISHFQSTPYPTNTRSLTFSQHPIPQAHELSLSINTLSHKHTTSHFPGLPELSYFFCASKYKYKIYVHFYQNDKGRLAYIHHRTDKTRKDIIALQIHRWRIASECILMNTNQPSNQKRHYY